MNIINPENVYSFLTKTVEKIREDKQKFQELNKAMNAEGYQAWITPKGTYWAKKDEKGLVLHPMYDEKTEQLLKQLTEVR